jgi:formylglycine-generating enzyme required for sulfatase activity
VRSLPLALLLGCASAPPPAFESAVGLRFVLLPAGEFVMGSSKEEADRAAAEMAAKKVTSWYPDSPRSEAPPRKTSISRPFYLATTETTLGAFRRFVEATGYRTEAERDGKGADGRRDGRWTTGLGFDWREMGYARTDDFPVTNVTWDDAVAFCVWLSTSEGRRFRLPTEAEWEYACRAGSTGRAPWGDEAAARDAHAWTGANAGGGPHPVGTRKPNAWGLHDMIGNVYEYCSDYFAVAPYDPAQAVDPTGPSSGPQRVVRSISWGTHPMHARSAFRGGAGPGHRNMRDGFRVACD